MKKMKKRIIVTLVSSAMALSMLSGCGKEKVTQSTTDVSKSTTLGKYYLYETTDAQEYLAFLETYDKSRYEVVDISIGYYGPSITGNYLNHYAVTYRDIEE